MPNFELQELQQFTGVCTVDYRESMPSTSDTARETLLQNSSCEMPLLVLCDLQTAGRGQREKTWQSNSNSLTFTWCIEDCSIPIENHSLLPLIAGVCVCDAIKSLGIEGAKLKWPNDVLIDRQKVSGILVEKISTGSRSSFLFGIGVNVNQTDAASLRSKERSHFPPSSLRLCTGRSVNMQSLLSKIVEKLSINTKAKEDWPKKCLPFLNFVGTNVDFVKPDGEIVKGVFRGINEIGKIEIEADDGTSQFFASGHLSPEV